ncbi:MAG TPA: F0F1 ATP synthase subunit A, partial [Planctomycetia bacterium]|nr:F0F1 ATP synthase subunit A [Planctomycetia bacterium]
ASRIGDCVKRSPTAVFLRMAVPQRLRMIIRETLQTGEATGVALGTTNIESSAARWRWRMPAAMVVCLAVLCVCRAAQPGQERGIDPPRNEIKAVGSPGEPEGAAATHPASPESIEHVLSQQALPVFTLIGFPVTNSMIVTWAVAAGLILFARAATRKMEPVPAGAQNVAEWLVESLYDFLEGVIGKRLVDRTFWFFASVFLFILAANCIGLLPGVGTIGWGHTAASGFQVTEPLFRGASADLNLTMAMALVFFACWIYWVVSEVGVGGLLKDLFLPKGESTGFMRVVLAIVFFAVGCLEVISILFRPISLSFRLYGNTFAGENMLETMAGLVPGLGWLLPIPFYLLELLVGLVQATVFMLLTAVFTLLVCQHAEEGGDERKTALA